MGLDESRFGHVVTTIIEADVLPDLILAKCITKWFERRIARIPPRVVSNNKRVLGFATRREGSTSGDSTGGRNGSRDEHSSSVSQKRGRDRTCSNCGRSGHEKNACWQLIEYPEWFTE